MGKYFLSILYLIVLYFFWCGVIPAIFDFKSPVGAIGFASGLLFVYPIANIAEKNGDSWWKNFLLYGFLTTGIPIIGIIKLIILKKAPAKSNTNEINNNSVYDDYNKNIIIYTEEERINKEKEIKEKYKNFEDMFNDENIMKNAKEIRRMYGKSVYVSHLKS